MRKTFRDGSPRDLGARAVHTIRSSRPKIALSIYHKAGDLRTFSHFVTGMDLGYRYALRQHDPVVPDATVLYCRPS